MSTRRKSLTRNTETNSRDRHEGQSRRKQSNRHSLQRAQENLREHTEEQQHEQVQIPETKELVSSSSSSSSSLSESTFKFLVTTDNHLGFAERDPRRGDDSFTTFEEILRAARIEHDVDAILLGGDLFHDNKPSLGCMARTCSLLRKYVMGNKSIPFQLLSDPAVNFPTHPLPLANFQDPNINIALPIFVIHGNHDDPVGGTSALDILAVNGYVNYFGHTSSLEDIVLQPILLQKGHTYIALYGLGNVRDERLHRCFELNKVHFMYPKPTPHIRWFNILIVHQNRNVRGSYSKAGIPEHMLANFGMDLVIWGNEHEQRITPEPSHGFDVIQPGSTVMTAFSAQECNKKQYGVLEIRFASYRLTPFPLRSVRPAIRRVVELWRENPQGRTLDAVEEFLQSVMEDMIHEAEEQISQIPDDVLTFHPNLKFPLMRLAVDFGNVDGAPFPQPNLTRFGQQYMDVVANPAELLRPIKSKPTRNARQALLSNNINSNHSAGEANNGYELSDFIFPTAPQLSTMDIRSKVAEVFHSNSKDACTLLSEPEVSTAVYAFAEKGERDAIDERIAELLDLTQRAVWRKLNNGSNASILKNDVIMAAVGQHKLEMNRRFARANLTGETLRAEEKNANIALNSNVITTTNSSNISNSNHESDMNHSDMEDNANEEIVHNTVALLSQEDNNSTELCNLFELANANSGELANNNNSTSTTIIRNTDLTNSKHNLHTDTNSYINDIVLDYEEEEKDKEKYEEDEEELEPLPDDGLRRVRVDDLAARIEDVNIMENAYGQNNASSISSVMLHSSTTSRKRARTNTESTIEDILASINENVKNNSNESNKSKEVDDSFGNDRMRRNGRFNTSEDSGSSYHVNYIHDDDDDDNRNENDNNNVKIKSSNKSLNIKEFTNAYSEKCNISKTSSARSRKKGKEFAKGASMVSKGNAAELGQTHILPTLALSSYKLHEEAL